MPGHQQYTDNELVELLKEGERDAFATIYRRYAALLHRFSLSILNDPDKAQDIVHDVLLVLWERRKKLEIHSSLSGWLYTATRNQVRKQIRHSKVEATYLETLQRLLDQHVSIDQKLNEKELARRFEEELRLLPPKMREAFELSRKQEYSYREISKKMNISDNTVRNHISHALKILRTRLSGLFYYFL